jgi:PAS domain S-box-containing protein
MPETMPLDIQLLRLALDNLADSVTIHDASGKLLYANEATSELMGGQSTDEILEAEPGAWTARFEMYHEDGTPVDLAELPGRRVFLEGEGGELLVRRVDRQTGSNRWIRIKAAPLHDAEGRIVAAANVSEDVTEVKEAEQAQRLLADAGAALATSLDYERTLQLVAQLAVPEFADWCGVDLLTDAGDIEPVAIAHVEPEKAALGRELRSRYPIDPDDDEGTPAVLRTGQSELIQEIPDELLVDAARDEQHLDMLRAIGLNSVLIVPLSFGNRRIGTMSFVLGPPRKFSESDVRLAEELARRAVTAIENSRLYTDRTRIARTLQEGLLPPRLAAPPGFETAVLFRAAGMANEVGGDFYDVIRLGDDWLAFIGDVAGKGAAAAALTARARYTLISVAELTGSVDEAIARVNTSMLEMTGLPLCTVACVRLGADGMDALSAGHPLPYRLGRDGAAPVGRPGPLLGFDAGARWPRERLEIAPGEAVILYSDGVIDTLGPDRERFGERRFAELLEEGRGDSAAELVERIDQRLLNFQDSEQRDDVAVLVLRREG